ncbi:MAG: cupin domain-containing protein [Eubacterium sp.]|nr:cupin domain-containing protein [Eubacterium sp.]
MSELKRIFETKAENYVLRDWGGEMCFLATDETAGAEKIFVTAVLRMRPALDHDAHFHDDGDEMLVVLDGEGSQSFWDDPEDPKKESRYPVRPGDVMYIIKNRIHRTDNASNTKPLYLFIMNYNIEGQSAFTHRGIVFSEETKEQETDFGTVRQIFNKTVCGNDLTEGEFLTVLPGKEYSAAPAEKEDVIFNISGSCSITSEETGACDFNTRTLGFFHAGESYTLKNTGETPARFWHVRVR